jgi:hypothetical protein
MHSREASEIKIRLLVAEVNRESTAEVSECDKPRAKPLGGFEWASTVNARKKGVLTG